MNWGKSIIFAFALFGAFIATLVTVCMQQDISLVTKDYYKEELAYQQHIDRVAHTAMLSEKPSIAVEGGNMLKISYSGFSNIEAGALKLFRPSNPDMDKTFTLRKGPEALQYFSTAGMQKGMYRARLEWTMNGKGFFLEQVIFL